MRKRYTSSFILGEKPMKAYALKAGDGWTYHQDVPFTIKAGEVSGRGAAILEFTTRKGEEPPMHSHPSEDEVFYVLKGEMTFHCGGENFEVSEGGFVYLPKGIEHGYTILSEGDVKLLVITFPPNETPNKGWDGFVADLETRGELVNKPDGE
jgi:quercetin dioxygenase-like cupin family protein